MTTSPGETLKAYIWVGVADGNDVCVTNIVKGFTVDVTMNRIEMIKPE